MIKAKMNKFKDTEIPQKDKNRENGSDKLYVKVDKYKSVDGKIFLDKEEAIKYSADIEKQEMKLRQLDLYLEKRRKMKNNT